MDEWDCTRLLALAQEPGAGFDATDDLALGEAGDDQLAGFDLVRGADQGYVIAAEGQAVAAGEDGERAEGVEARGEPGQPEAAIEM